MRLITTNIIDKGLEEKQTKQEKLDFLVEIMDEIFDLFEMGEITDTDRENLDFYSVNKAKKILGHKE